MSSSSASHSNVLLRSCCSKRDEVSAEDNVGCRQVETRSGVISQDRDDDENEPLRRAEVEEAARRSSNQKNPLFRPPLEKDKNLWESRRWKSAETPAGRVDRVVPDSTKEVSQGTS